MKRIGLVAFATALSLSTMAQDGFSKMNNFKVNLLSPLIRTLNLGYERKLNEMSSFQLGVAYTGYGADGIKLRGLAITPEYRRFLSNSKEALEGFYIAPFLRYRNISISNDDGVSTYKAKYNGFGGGVAVGHQWIFRDIVSLDVFGGPGYSSSKYSYEGDATEDDFDLSGLGFGSFTFRAGVTLGIVF